jgi:hypothetical protein
MFCFGRGRVTPKKKPEPPTATVYNPGARAANLDTNLLQHPKAPRSISYMFWHACVLVSGWKASVLGGLPCEGGRLGRGEPGLRPNNRPCGSVRDGLLRICKTAFLVLLDEVHKGIERILSIVLDNSIPGNDLERWVRAHKILRNVAGQISHSPPMRAREAAH